MNLFIIIIIIIIIVIIIFCFPCCEAKVACHDMFKLMDRQSLIEGLEPAGSTEEKLHAGTIEFKEASRGDGGGGGPWIPGVEFATIP